MGLDVGEKRIGVALSDPLGWTAQGHSVVLRRNTDADLQALAQIAGENQVERVVIGFPRNMNGTVGFKAQEIQKFGQMLEQTLKLPVEYWDERLSTVSAEKVLIAADVSRKKRKGVIDMLAAVNILQNYLDRQAHK